MDGGRLVLSPKDKISEILSCLFSKSFFSSTNCCSSEVVLTDEGRVVDLPTTVPLWY